MRFCLLLFSTLVALTPSMSGADAFDLEGAIGRAGSGDVEAMFEAGRAYYKGDGAPRDLAKAAEFLRKAAEGGHARAQTTFGTMLVQGSGVGKDLAAAFARSRGAPSPL